MRNAASGPNSPDTSVTLAGSADEAGCGPPQHFLNFFPLPQGQRSFLPMRLISVIVARLLVCLPHVVARCAAVAPASILDLSDGLFSTAVRPLVRAGSPFGANVALENRD